MLSCVAAFFLFYVLGYNLQNLQPETYRGLYNRDVRAIGYLARVNATWGMFAPRPSKSTIWYTLPATLVDGTTVDLFFDNRPFSGVKPRLGSELYLSHRWRPYMEKLRTSACRRLRPYFVAYKVRRWNQAHTGAARQVASVALYMNYQRIEAENRFGPIKRTRLYGRAYRGVPIPPPTLRTPPRPNLAERDNLPN